MSAMTIPPHWTSSRPRRTQSGALTHAQTARLRWATPAQRRAWATTGLATTPPAYPLAPVAAPLLNPADALAAMTVKEVA